MYSIHVNNFHLLNILPFKHLNNLHLKWSLVGILSRTAQQSDLEMDK